jgi:signal peptidase I
LGRRWLSLKRGKSRVNDARINLRVQGHSMWPRLHSGERVMLEIPPYSRAPRWGDIVLIRQPDCFLLHRVIAVRHMHGKKIYLTRGDNSPGVDPPVSSGDMLGHLVAIERCGRMININRGLRRITELYSTCLSCVGLWLFCRIRDLRNRLTRIIRALFRIKQ